jgi:hypothetical protein
VCEAARALACHWQRFWKQRNPETQEKLDVHEVGQASF